MRARVTDDAVAEIVSQAAVGGYHQNIRLQIIIQAIKDLAPQSYGPDDVDFPAEMYFQHQNFREDATWCDLDPDWVVEVLERHNLLKDGRRVDHVFTHIHAA